MTGIYYWYHPAIQGRLIMSKVLSLKLQEEVFRETEEILQSLRKPRNAYLNEAINLYNKLWKRRVLKEALVQDSALVAEDSLEVLEVFEQLEDELVE
jgi:hypothetical protein